MTPALQLNLFGSPQISYQGQPLTGFVSTKVRALLIYLAVTARPHSRDQLAELLWADTSTSMRANLKKALSNLRHLPGVPLVEGADGLVLLDQRYYWVDVLEFTQALQTASAGNVAAWEVALQRYQGDFLSGFNLSLSYEFEKWALSEQSRFRSQMIDLLHKLATRREAEQDFKNAIAVVRRLLEIEPWQEESHRRLICLLAKNGQRSAALAHFAVCKQVLKEELDVEPDDETLQLVEQIQQAAMTVNKSPPKPHPTPTAIAKPEFPLIGREQEWQTIQARWRHCLSNGAHLICIGGEAGIGKTRLTEEARLWVAQQGYATAYARSYAAEGDLAYSPIVDWLRSEALRPALQGLDPVWLTEVARLLPELLTTHPHLAPPQPMRDSSQRRHFFEALARTMGAGEQARLLVIDDLHWCDQETLEWLRYFLRFTAHQPCLVLGTFRVEEVEPDHPLHELLRSLHQSSQVTQFELGMLTPPATRQLIGLVVQRELAENQLSALYKETVGHPLFVIESLRHRADEVADGLPTQPQSQPTLSGQPARLPAKIYNVIQSRLTRLSPGGRELVELAAIVGRAFPAQLLLVAGKREELLLFQQLDELWQRRLIAARDGAQFDFTHDRIRDAVAAGVSPVKRQIYHRYLVQGLTTIHAADLAPVSGQIADHCEQAGLFAQAVSHYQQAANHARQFFANYDALHYRQKALQLVQQLPPSPGTSQQQIDLLLELGHDRIVAGGWGNSPIGETWLQAYELAKENGSPAQLCQAQIDLARYYRSEGVLALSHQFSSDALAQAQSVNDAFLTAKASFALASVLFHQGRLTESLTNFEVVCAWARTATRDPSTRAAALFRSGQCLWLLGFPDQAQSRMTAAMNLILQEHPEDECMVLHHYVMLLYFCRDVAMVGQISKQLVTLAPKLGENARFLIGKLYHGWSVAHEIDVRSGLVLIQSSIVAVLKDAKEMFAPTWLGILAEVRLLAGEVDRAQQEVHQAITVAKETTNCYWLAHLLQLRGALNGSAGAPSHKIEQSYREALTVAQQQGAKSLELRAANRLCRLWQQQGNHAAAYQLLAPLYDWFTEGFDTVDLIEAKQLLSELAR